MTLSVVLTAEATEDATQIATYIGRRSLTAAGRFASALAATLTQLATAPELGTLYKFKQARLAEVRLWPVQDFPNYIVFYRPTDRELTIVRVLHAARDWPAILDA